MQCSKTLMGVEDMSQCSGGPPVRGSSFHVMFSGLSAGDQEFVSRVKVRPELMEISKKIFDTSQHVC